MKNNEFIFLGPPGSGKGTQAKTLAVLLGVSHISTGDIFRDQISKQTELGIKAKAVLDAGNLMPDDITNSLISARLKQPDAINGFILDGYPRNLAQAEFLFTLKPETKVINIELSDKEVLCRVAGRRLSRSTGAIYHLEFNLPPPDLPLDDLIQRPDETETVVQERLSIYYQQIEPLKLFYQQKGKLLTVDGSPSIIKVTESIVKLINV
ncbi:MAG: nucleoside monophosphate kinase [Patescibacteria group bacterium]